MINLDSVLKSRDIILLAKVSLVKAVVFPIVTYGWASPVTLVVKKPPADAGDTRDVGSIRGLGRSPGKGHDNPRQYSSLENPMDKGAWRATAHSVTKSQTQLKRRLLLGRKAMTNLDRDITLPAKVCLVKAMAFPIVMYGCESWAINKAECCRIDAFELWFNC